MARKDDGDNTSTGVDENRSSNDYDINIKNDTGKIITVKVKSSDTIGSVKLKIQATENIPFEQQELFFNEKVLENINTLANLHIVKDSTLNVMEKTVQLMELYVNTFTGKTIFLRVKPLDTVAKVKSLVESSENIPSDEQAVIYNDVVLVDKCSLFDLHLNTKSTLTVMRKSKGLTGSTEITGIMDISVKTFTGKTVTLKVKPSDTIESIKAKIQEVEDIPSDEQEVVLNGIVLHNKSTLADFQVTKETTLTLMRVWSGFMRLYIKTLAGKTVNMDVKPSWDINKLKIKIYNKEGTHPSAMKLIWNGRELLGSATLADYHIPNESTFDLRTQPSIFFRPQSHVLDT